MNTWDRFWPKVTMSDGCWEWTGAKADGYGHFAVGGSAKPAHKVLYEQEVGPVPQGMVLDHLCLNRACVRPDHVEPVTVRENLMRGQGLAAMNAAQTHCRRGHEFSDSNTRLWRGKRICKQCKVSGLREWRAAQRRKREIAA